MPKVIIEPELLKNSYFSKLEMDTDLQPPQIILTTKNEKAANDICKKIYASINAVQQYDETSKSEPYELALTRSNDLCIIVSGDLMKAASLLFYDYKKFITVELYKQIRDILKSLHKTPEAKVDNQLPQKISSPSSSSHLFEQSRSNASKQMLKLPKAAAELLETSLSSIIDSLQELPKQQQRLLFSVLQDNQFNNTKDKSAIAKLREIFYEIDNSINSIAPTLTILYCALHPESWENPEMGEYKKCLINRTLEIYGIAEKEKAADIVQQQTSCNNVIQNMHNFASNELEAEFKELNLTADEQLEITDIITRIMNAEQTSSIIEDKISYDKDFIKTHDELKDVYASINERSRAHTDPLPRQYVKKFKAENWENLSKKDQVWSTIFALIEYQPSSQIFRKRDESKMLEIVKAIFCKDLTHCSWRNLPQACPYWRQVYYYYKLWEKNGILDQIRAISYSNTAEVVSVQNQSQAKQGVNFFTSSSLMTSSDNSSNQSTNLKQV